MSKPPQGGNFICLLGQIKKILEKNIGNGLVLAREEANHSDFNPKHRILLGKEKYLKVR